MKLHRPFRWIHGSRIEQFDCIISDTEETPVEESVEEAEETPVEEPTKAKKPAIRPVVKSNDNKQTKAKKPAIRPVVKSSKKPSLAKKRKESVNRLNDLLKYIEE